MGVRALAAGMLALVAVPALAQVQTAADALAQDAAEYARVSGLALDEATRQLRAQADTVPVTDALASEFRERLAGISVQHRPSFGIDVALTGDEPVAPRWTTGGGVAVPISFSTGATATRAVAIAALTAHQAEIRAALPHPPGIGVDARTGALVVFLTQADAARFAPGDLESRLAGIVGAPVTLRIFDHQADSAVEGGARLEGTTAGDPHRYLCTTGFAVTDGAREGVVTAAHCPDDVSYVALGQVAIPLAFAGQWGWSFQDVQLNLSTEPLDPGFYADTAKTKLRPVTAVRSRASTRVGDVVCHRGERSGYACAEVEFVDFAPAGDLCGGPCAPTWVAAGGPSCHGGDSGGPVFAGTVALGIVKGGSYTPGGRCAFWFYMSTDYLPEGWRVLTVPPLQGDWDRSVQPSGGGASHASDAHASEAPPPPR